MRHRAVTKTRIALATLDSMAQMAVLVRNVLLASTRIPQVLRLAPAAQLGNIPLSRAPRYLQCVKHVWAILTLQKQAAKTQTANVMRGPRDLTVPNASFVSLENTKLQRVMPRAPIAEQHNFLHKAVPPLMFAKTAL